MAQLRGTNVASPILPFADTDRFPTHLAEYGKGGYRTVANLSDRDSIPTERQEEGMLVWVTSNETLYQLRSGEWREFKVSGSGEGGSSGEGQEGEGIQSFPSPSDIPSDYPGNFVYIESEKTFYVKDHETGEWGPIESKSAIDPSEIEVPDTWGIPIYTKDMVESISPEPDNYISIPSESELGMQEPGGNGYYVDILFSAIRSLQAEVAKLKNSMKYGLYSYTGRETAMSNVMAEHSGVEEEEPLWATEESDLSAIDGIGASVESDNLLEPAENVELRDGWLKINGEASWRDGFDVLSGVADPKLYVYLTTNSKNVVFRFLPELELSLSSLGIPSTDKYNILLILSRKKQEAGDNFVWLSVAGWATGETLAEGYWSPDENRLKTGKTSLPEELTLDEIVFGNLELYKFNIYSKYQDFSKTVLPSTPSDEDYKYRVAHITIRSVLNYSELDAIKDQLPKNELIYNEETGVLYIKLGNGKVKSISSRGGSDSEETTSGMEKQEIIEWLAANGIIVTEEGGELSLSPVSDITFVHQGTGKKFKFESDSEGNLHATELSNDTYEGPSGILNVNNFDPDSAEMSIRGFVGTLGDKKLIKNQKPIAIDKDHGLYSDRVKIGAIYAPIKSLTTHGCSHAFIELENTSEEDFLLDGCYLHYATGISGNGASANIRTYHLALEGKIPAGGTYLIRGKQYTSPSQANCFINVATYDKEWYIGNGELIDLTPAGPAPANDTTPYSNTYLLTYGLPDLDWKTVMWAANTDSSTLKKAPWVYDPHYIDSVSIGGPVFNGESNANSTWNPYKKKDTIAASAYYAIKTFDCIYKNTFELEPAKQGYQSAGTIDSSRVRGVTAADFQYLRVNSDVIEFPKTAETFPVKRYTPKASFEHKNVCTDKSKLDMDKPNMVTCSFGINIHTTRCFNWISAGEFDEFVWLRPKGSATWASRFESYKASGESDKPGSMTKVSFPAELKAAAYNRLYGTFPANGTHYTSHKCIINIVSEAVSEPTEYEYVVGRADKNKNPDPNHTGEIQTFTLYPTSWKPRIFQTTDQQGFHWIEYQAWAAAAEEVNKLINSELEAGEHIIPILVNTGDMTQNGTRINEWLDYYNAGKCLFNHLEQMNVVGNNDLVGTNPEKLGTGDDQGKSNGHYFHVFYCYEVDPEVNPIIPSTDGAQVKYIPSFYYFENDSTSDDDKYRFVFLNTEITTINCRDWYRRTNNEGEPINVYTGWPITDRATAEYDSGFKTIYSMIYQILSGAGNRHIIAACHEMPFTVVTGANLLTGDKGGKAGADRSMNGASLVGCHCNREGSLNEKSIYWLSRLLENFGVKLMIGGHKHTYAITNPLREFYFYDGGTKNSLQDGPMTMESTLEHDDQVSWTASVGLVTDGAQKIYQYGVESETKVVINTTKFPIMIVPNETPEGVILNSDTWLPCYGLHSDSYTKVVYSMCQATGFKLKSNKELPSDQQKFSYAIPKTTVGTGPDAADTPHDNQLKPMFVELVLENSTYSVYLMRIEEITNGTKLFSQDAFSKNSAYFMYLKHEKESEELDILYGHWVNNKVALIEIED